MGRIIEVDDITALPDSIAVGRADVLILKVTGAQVTIGSHLLEMIGPLIPGVIAGNGQIISPEGAPNTIVLVARQSGEAQIQVATGNPFYTSGTKVIKVCVE